MPRRLALEPCLNDVGNVSQALSSLGFQVHFVKDLSYKSMKSMTDQFVNSIQPDVIVILYFSGHACQFNDNNYLIPMNADEIWTGNVNSTAIDAQNLISAMDSKHPRLIMRILG
ncbi:unnamed protein product [Rotaria sp. Silwood2]|nr:unnamed protein product [Rotaria sp. Silwood2]CAF2644482.1 unnamed protein product [Rotaria sp. Silwood2]CAF2904513.1 unnamed protein product [Rotaria sp. Silwood2]CAF3057942.1 unnamed protein product [Rotaria sp. Silwood2]CAF3872269.1 unnamed protein product [Rotaria sp. Silwood2]